MDNNKRINLGNFIELKDAIDARKKAEKKYGYHENHGKVFIENKNPNHFYAVNDGVVVCVHRNEL